MQEEAKAHPSQFDKRSPEERAAGEPEVAVRVIDIKDGSLLIRAYVWAPDPVTARVMRYELNERILKRFKEEHIGVALPIRHLVQHNPFIPSTIDDHG